MSSSTIEFVTAHGAAAFSDTALSGSWDGVSVLAHSGDPAGGAPLADLVPASIVAVVAVAALGVLAVAYRRGGAGWLRRLAGFSERVSGLPAWAALPAAIGGVALVVAVFGFYWDVATHIDNGRDAGPFANPSHFFILAGLAGITVAGYVAVLVGTGRPTATSVHLSDDWHAPVGGLLLLLCGVVALAGFPLDDVWHRLFGQDVTLWGPTHIQMIGGASLSTLAIWALLREAGHPTEGAGHRSLLVVRYRDVLLAGALLLGLSTLQGEFDYGVPQFALLYHPVLLTVAAGIGLVAARLLIGPGGALASVAFFVLMRGALALIVGPVLGRSLLHFPLFLIEALVVEAVAMRVPRDRQISMGAAAGVLIGTLGLAAEWGWSHVWMPLPWPRALLPEALIAGFAAAVASGTLGGFIGRALSPRSTHRQSVPALVPIAAIVALVASLTYPGITTDAPDVQATVELQDSGRHPQRWVDAVIRLDPPDAARDAMWFEVLAWQGREWQDGGLVRVDLDSIGRGVYRTTGPFPVHGEWKAIVRLHRDRSLQALPLYLPEDPGIPADEVPAQPQFTRDFVSDKELLQREAQGGSATLQAVGYLLLLAIAALWLAAVAWGLERINRGTASPDHADDERRPAVGTGRR